MVSPEEAVASLAALDGATASVFARELGGETLVAHHPERALAPASNAKLLTSALALDVLGPDYRFETRATGYGEVAAGRLDGDLALVGSGAPDLESDDLRELARAVREAGIETVAGDLVFDGSRFDDRRLGPGWTVDDPKHAYGAPSAALSLDGNRVTVELRDPDGPADARDAGRSGDTADFEVRVEPDTDAVTVAADVSVGDDDLRVYADRETGVVRVEGTLPAGAERTERAPVASPERHCAAAFRDALAEAGVEVEGDVRPGPVRNRGAAFSRAVESAPVADLLRRMNVPSDNFVAEQLARAVAVERASEQRTGGEDASLETWDVWEDVATEFLESLGVTACRVRDGSGLSRYDLVPARGLAALLSWVAEQPWSEAFFASLPAPGEGTLENRLTDVPNVRAKTGTLTGTVALSGVVRRGDDADVCFAALLSGLTDGPAEPRERLDEFVRSLV